METKHRSFICILICLIVLILEGFVNARTAPKLFPLPNGSFTYKPQIAIEKSPLKKTAVEGNPPSNCQPTCTDGYAVYKNGCRKCDCGGDINCIFMPLAESTAHVKKCLCPSGYGGEESCTKCNCGGEIHNCTFKISPLVRGQTIKSCVCASGYESNGENCQKINPCKSNPCKNGGKCNFDGSDYNCTCDKLYKGRICEIEIDLCEPNPCRNSGKCLINGTNYNCLCDEPFSGKNCEINTDLCQPNPCRNGGNCTDNGTDYNCTCSKIHKGKNCETRLSVCDPNPCLNGGSCTQNGTSFLCKCRGNYSGKVCSERDDSDTNVHLKAHRLQIVNFEWVAIGQNASSNGSLASTELLNILKILKTNLIK